MFLAYPAETCCVISNRAVESMAATLFFRKGKDIRLFTLRCYFVFLHQYFLFNIDVLRLSVGCELPLHQPTTDNCFNRHNQQCEQEVQEEPEHGGAAKKVRYQRIDKVFHILQCDKKA